MKVFGTNIEPAGTTAAMPWCPSVNLDHLTLKVPMTVAEKFAEFGASLHSRSLSPDVIHHAKRAVVDWYAALVPGSVTSPATLLETALHEDLDRGTAHLALGRPATTPHHSPDQRRGRTHGGG